jgi:hypothetical protein
MFFGTTDAVCQWDTGYADDETGIVADMKTAFNYFGSRGDLKKFEMLQPVYRIANNISPAVEVVTDFKESIPTAVPTTIRTTGATWDFGVWDSSVWASATETRDSWTSVTGIGYCGAVRLRVEPDPLLFLDLAVDADTVVSYDGDGIVSIQEPSRATNSTVEIVAFNLKFQNQTGGQL